MWSQLTLDAPTLVIANLITSVATVGLLLITRFGLGPAGARMDGWIAGEVVLLTARFGYPLVWLLADLGWNLPIEKLVPPLVVIGLCCHVIGLRQARTRAPRIQWWAIGASVLMVGVLYALSQPLSPQARHTSFVASLAVVWLAMLREAWPMRHGSWGGRGLVIVAAVVATANVLIALHIGPAPRGMMYGPGLLIETVVVLLITSCYLMWLQEDLRQRLTDLAQNDALTGVLNRHGLLPGLKAQLAEARRTGRPLAVVLCDLDHFKRVNDMHGHATGDAVLRRFARLAVQTVRQGDPVGRWGGEEFLIVLPGTDAQAAVGITERLQAVCALPDEAQPGLPPFTFSAGVASTADSNEPVAAEALIALADRRLYLAKVRRNCVVRQDAPTELPRDPIDVLPVLPAVGTLA